MGLNRMEKFENMMSDCSELKRHRSQRTMWNLRHWKNQSGMNVMGKQRRKRSGNLVIKLKIGTSFFDSASWGVLSAEDHISVLGRALGGSPNTYLHAPYPRYSTFFSHFNCPQTIRKYMAVLCPDETVCLCRAQRFPTSHQRHNANML